MERKGKWEDGWTLNYKLSNLLILKATQELGQGDVGTAAAASEGSASAFLHFQQIGKLSTATE